MRHKANLLGDTVTHETMKEQVRLAIRDLDEASSWLEEEDIEARHTIVAIADLIINLAKSRLTLVGDALNRSGPNASLIG